MRPGVLILLSFLGTIYTLSGQTFPGQAGALIPPGAPGVTIGLTTAICTVSGVGTIGDGCTKIDSIAIDITHTYTGDLGIFLISPGGDVLELTSGNGGTGNNFTSTVFTDYTTPFITSGSAPYTGLWRPEGRQQGLSYPYSNVNPLGTYTFDNVFDGVAADGDWTLYINDFLLVDVGVINSWSISFSGGPGPVPTVDLGPDVIICEDQSTVLFADVTPGADTWEWSTGETTQSITVNPVSSTTYTVTVANNGCTGIDTIFVIVQPNNTNANAGPDEIICQGQQVLLTGSSGASGTSFLWSNGQSGPLINVNPNTTTTYTLTVTDGVCSGTDDVEVVVSPAPVVDAGPDMTICDGTYVELTASGGTQDDDYLWSTGDNAETITVSPFSTTTYTVTVTIDGCEGEDDVEVDVIPQPYVDAGDDETICIGDEALLTASGTGGEYEWSTGETGIQINVSPSQSTTYTISLTADGCTSTDDVEVEVIDVTADATPDFSLCEGEAEVISVSGGTDFEWSTGQTSAAITISPQSSTIYSVTVSEGNCADVATVMVNVIPSPIVDIIATQDICAGDTITITATGGSSYQWNTGATGAVITVNPLMTTLYIVTASDALCSTVDSVLITVHPSPLISVGPPVSLCSGDSVLLQVTGLAGDETLIWNTGDTASAITVSPITDGMYSITATNTFGCTDESSVSVMVLPAAIANAGSDVFIMAGDAATLSATGGGSYQWSTGQMMPGIIVIPAVTTTYTVTVTLNGCEDIDAVTVFVNEVPPVDLGPDITICSGETVMINAMVPGPFMLAYLWNTGEMDSSINVAPLSDSIFIITVTDITSGFSSIDSIHVFVSSLPLGQPVIAGPDEGCLQDVQSYTLSGITGATAYAWSVIGGNIISGQGTSGVNVEWTSPGLQQLMLIAANNCGTLPAILFTTDVLTPPLLTGPISGLIDPCVYALTGYSIASSPGASSYNWSITGGGIISSGQGTTNLVVDWNGASAGKVCVEAVNLCGVSAPVCMDVMPTQSPVISAGPDLEACGQTMSLQGSGVGTWDVVSGSGQLIITDPANPQTQVMSQSTGAYSLAYQSGTAGCETSDTVSITFLTAPLISQVIEVCSSDLMSYTVSFQITGGQQPYMVNGIPIATNVFVSNQVPAGNAYMFQVEDSNGCQSAVISGVQTCTCSSLAGLMDTSRINQCIGDSLIALDPVGTVTGPDDKLAFVLHDGLLPAGIIAWNDQPVFPFIASLQPGTTYYISAVVGPAGPGGFPDPVDPCFTWSVGTPFIFFEPPLIALQEMVTIACDTQMVPLDIGSSASGPEYLYNWTTAGGGVILGKTDTADIIAGSAGSYFLTIEHPLSGCTSTGEITVDEDRVDLSELQFDIVSPLCTGDCNGQLLIKQAGSNWLYDFGTGIFTDQLVFEEGCPGSYILSIKNESGCITDTIYTIPEPVPLVVDLGPDRMINPGESIQLEALSPGSIVLYNWYAVDTCTLCPVIAVHPDETTLYQVEVHDIQGCSASDKVQITVRLSKDIFLPNVFSPNGDQVNDELWIPEHPSLLSIHRFEIFDRWGNLVFRAMDHFPGSQAGKWDGRFHNTILNPGVYICVAEVEYRDGSLQQLVWDATLIR